MPVEHAGADDGAVAQPGDRDAGGVDGGRVFADGAQSQPEAGAKQHPPGERHHQEGEIDQDRMARDQLGIDRAEDRHVADGVGAGQRDRLEAGGTGQRRRAAALPEPGLAEDDGRAGGDEVDGDAGDDLVAAVGDRGEAVHQRHQHRDRRSPRARPSQAEPVTAAAAPPAKAPASILPSRPMSKTPARSE